MHHFSKIFKLLVPSFGFLFAPSIFADTVPAPLDSYFEFGEPVPAQVIIVKHVEDFLKFQNEILKKRAEDPKAFDEAYKDQDAGLPYAQTPFSGLSDEDHAAYLKAWDRRKIEPIAGVRLELEQGEGNKHRLHIVGGDPRVIPGGVARLHFNGNTGKIETLNGELERISDVNTKKNSILGPWNGVEWRGAVSDGILSTTENLVVGQRTDDTFCYMIYRKREAEPEGRVLVDRTLLLRFLPKAKRKMGK